MREPFNGLSHLGGAFLSCAALPLLVGPVWDNPVALTGFLVYGLSLVVLYTASTLYHLPPLRPDQIPRFMALDQSAIYLLIAGSYTPICLVSLDRSIGWTLLCQVWAIALAGIGLRIFWKQAPVWLCFVLYLLMGWLCTTVLGPLQHALSPAGTAWLFAGGLIYTVGAIIFASKRPRLWPGVFGSHELWHVCVLGGSACHFVVMLVYVQPFG